MEPPYGHLNHWLSSQRSRAVQRYDSELLEEEGVLSRSDANRLINALSSAIKLSENGRFTQAALKVAVFPTLVAELESDGTIGPDVGLRLRTDGGAMLDAIRAQT